MAFFKQIVGRIKYRKKGINIPIGVIKLLNSMVPSLHKTRDNQIVKRYFKDKPVTFAIDMTTQLSLIHI